MPRPSFFRCLRTVGALAAAAALSGCIVYPAYGPRYGYFYRPHSHYYY